MTTGLYLDGRTAYAKRIRFVVEANVLKRAVKHDWSGFHADPRVHAVQDAAHALILGILRDKQAGTRREKKVAALSHNRHLLGELPTLSKQLVGQFVDWSGKCPTMSDRDLERTVNVLAKLEQSRWGYDLLARLEACSTDRSDTANEIMLPLDGRQRLTCC